jgi:hypothetical protein
MGGIDIPLAQQRLVDRGSSLRDAYHVEHVALFSPGAWPGGLPCSLCSNPTVGGAFAAFTVVDSVRGSYVQLPPAVLIALAWSGPNGTLAPGAPTPAEVTALGWGSDESNTAFAHLLGTPTIPRATFDTGIFGRRFGTKLDVVGFQNDTIVPPAEAEAAYQYATGESPASGFTTVDGADAVHGKLISDPAGVLAAIKGRVKFR